MDQQNASIVQRALERFSALFGREDQESGPSARAQDAQIDADWADHVSERIVQEHGNAIESLKSFGVVWRAASNIQGLLEQEGASHQDVREWSHSSWDNEAVLQSKVHGDAKLMAERNGLGV